MARSRSAASGPRECLSRWPLQCRDLRWRTQEPRVLSHKFEGLVRKYDQAICYGNCAIYFGQWWKLSSKAMSFFFCLSSGRQFASRKSFIRIVDSVHFLSVWGTQCSIRAAFERGGGFTLQLSRFVSYWSTKTSRIPCQAASHGSWGCHELNSTERNLGSRGGISVILTEQRVAVCKTYQNISSSNQDLWWFPCLSLICVLHCHFWPAKVLIAIWEPSRIPSFPNLFDD